MKPASNFGACRGCPAWSNPDRTCRCVEIKALIEVKLDAIKAKNKKWGEVAATAGGAATRAPSTRRL